MEFQKIIAQPLKFFNKNIVANFQYFKNIIYLFFYTKNVIYYKLFIKIRLATSATSFATTFTTVANEKLIYNLLNKYDLQILQSRFAIPFTTFANEKFYLQLMQFHLQPLQTDVAKKVASGTPSISLNIFPFLNGIGFKKLCTNTLIAHETLQLNKYIIYSIHHKCF